MLRLHMLKVCSFCAIVLFPTLGTNNAMAADAMQIPPTNPVVVENELPVVPAPVAAVETPDVVAPPPVVQPQTAVIPPSTAWKMRPMNDGEFTSAMCVLGATAGMAATYAVGPNEVIMLIVGGVVVPSSPTILFLTLFGTMAAAGCTIGSAGTPAISWLYNNYNTGQ